MLGLFGGFLQALERHLVFAQIDAVLFFEFLHKIIDDHFIEIIAAQTVVAGSRFYFENAIVFKAAPFLAQTHVEYRVRQYMTLARFAFAQGHPYWGYRFLGWGLHYLQDLSQPYHASILPGVGTMKMLFVNNMAERMTC